MRSVPEGFEHSEGPCAQRLSVSELLVKTRLFPPGRREYSEVKRDTFSLREGGNVRSDVKNCYRRVRNEGSCSTTLAGCTHWARYTPYWEGGGRHIPGMGEGGIYQDISHKGPNCPPTVKRVGRSRDRPFGPRDARFLPKS